MKQKGTEVHEKKSTWERHDSGEIDHEAKERPVTMPHAPKGTHMPMHEKNHKKGGY